MEHILDNPIYNALSTGNTNFSGGDDRVKYFPNEVAPFAGLKENAAADFNTLYRISPAESFFVLFAPEGTDIPPGWKIRTRMNILQMVCDRPVFPAEKQGEPIALQEKDVPAMLALTKMTNPGPFYSGTIRFGHYTGIFNGSQLVAMAGQRLHPGPYAEISAVCTHPDFQGRGYGTLLISGQIRRILAASEIPFLHVLKDNARTVALYEKLGFRTRAELTGYAMQKQAL